MKNERMKELTKTQRVQEMRKKHIMKSRKEKN